MAIEINYTKLKNSKKNELIEKLEYFYGCKLNKLQKYNFYMNERNKKLYITTCNLSLLNFKKISGLGLYFGTFHDEDRFRLSIEGSKFIIPIKNYITLNDENLSSYISGEILFTKEVKDMDWQNRCPFLIVRYKEDSIGCISPKKEELLNYVPKSRRLHFNKVY